MSIPKVIRYGWSCLLWCLLFTAMQATAQVSVAGFATDPLHTAITRDKFNNIYTVAYNEGSSRSVVVKYSNANPNSPELIYTSDPEPLINGEYYWGIAVNSKGDIYLSTASQTFGYGKILRMRAAGSSYQLAETVRSNYGFVTLAFDQRDNLLVIERDPASGKTRLMKYPAGNESGAGTVLYDQLVDQLFNSYPTGLVVDKNNTVYFTGYWNSLFAGSIYRLKDGETTPTTFGWGAYTSLACDANGNVYALDAGNANVPGTGLVVRFMAESLAVSLVYSGVAADIGSGQIPWGIAVNENGSRIYFDQYTSPGVRMLSVTPTTVTGTLLDASPSNANTVYYNVAFNTGPQPGLTTSAFSVITTGSVTGASVASIASNAGGYKIGVNTGAGDGTVALVMTGNNVVVPIDNAPYTGPAYTIDKTAPTGTLIINNGAASTNNTAVKLAVTATDANPGISMAFSNDGTTFSGDQPITSPVDWTLTAGDNVKNVYVRLRDQAGNVRILNSSINLDTKAPMVTFVATPPAISTSTNGAFSFDANEPATYEVRQDGGNILNATSPYTYTGLASGAHVFSVRATDQAGNQSGWVSYNWTIDPSPSVTSVVVPGTKYYNAGNALVFDVVFDQNVLVNTAGGTPFIELVIGSQVRQAVYQSNPSPTTMRFSYSVQMGDEDMDGITVNALKLSGATIRNAAGYNAMVTLNSMGSTAGVKVNTTMPTCVITMSAPSPVNADFILTAVFSEAVTGVSAGSLNIINATVRFLGGDGTTFTFKISPINEGSYTVDVPRMAARQAVGGNYNQPSNRITFINDRTSPVVSSVAVPAPKYYRAGDPLDFDVTFNEDVVVNTTGGIPAVQLVIGSVTRQAAFLSNPAPNVARFRYAVAAGDMDMNGITIGALSTNGGSVRDAAGNDASLTLNSVSTTAGVLVNTAHPTVVISTGAPAFINQSFTATITFSEAVTGFVMSDIAATNAEVLTLATNDNVTYTLTARPLGDGAVTLQVPADVALNIGGNGNQTSNALNLTADMTAPEVGTVGLPAAAYYGSGKILSFTINMSEAVAVTGTPYLPLTIGSRAVQADLVSTNGAGAMQFRYVVQSNDMDLDGITLGTNIVLNGGAIKDAAGNNAVPALKNVGSTGGIRVNTAIPAVTLSTSAVSPLNDAFTIVATFTDAIPALLSSAFTVSNGTASNVQTTDNITYTILITPAADGEVRISLPAGSAVNNAGTGNTASNTLSLTYDKTAPAVTGVTVPGGKVYAAGQQLNFNVVFTEAMAVSGVPSLPLIIGSSIVQATCTGITGTNTLGFSYTIQPGDMDANGITVGAALQLNGGSIRDIAGNAASLGLINVPATSGVIINTAIPSVVLSTSASSPLGGAFTATVVFSEAVSAPPLTAFVVSGGDASNLVKINNQTYTVLVTPRREGSVDLSLPAGIVINNAGTGNSTSNTLSVTYDITGPVVTSVTVPGNDAYAAGRTLNFEVLFDEPVTVTGTPSLPITIGTTTVQATYTGRGSSSNLYFSYVIKPGEWDSGGIQPGSAIRLNGGTIKDIVGNDADLTLHNVPATTGILVNTAMPGVALSTVAISPVNNAFTVTATFSEAVTGLAASAFQVTNGTADNLVEIDGTTYTVRVTPAADGPVQIQLPANAAMNNAHTGNSVSNSLSVTYDIITPKVSSVNVPGPGYYKTAEPLDFTVNMSEAVSVSGTPSIPLIIGSQIVQATYTGGSGTRALQFRYVVKDGDMDLNGIAVGATIQLNNGAIRDAAGNNAELTINNVASTTQVFVNTQAPTVTLSTTAANPVWQTFPLTITFSEAVTGFALNNVTMLSNGRFGPLVTADNITYTTTVTPVVDGVVNIRIPGGIVQNAAGNGNKVSNLLSLTADLLPPVVSSVDVPAVGYYKAGQPLDFNVNMSEPVTVTGTPSIPVVVGAQTVQATYTGGTGTATLQFRYTVQPGDMDMDGIAPGTSIQLNGGTIKDVVAHDAILTQNNVGNTSRVFVNTQHPTAVISTTAVSPIRQAFPVTITFSEAVTGFTSGGMTVTNGTPGQLLTTDNITYTTMITPSADGAVTVQVPAGAAQNIGGNGSQASDQLSLQCDATAPAIGQQAFDVYDNSPAGTVVGQLTGTDASGIVKDWTLATDGSRGALSLDADGRITVKDNTLLRTFAGNTVTLQVTASDGLNTSAAVPVTVKVLISYVNKQPVMDPVADVYLCATTAAQTIQLTGVSPVEPDQHYTISVTANQPYFDVLKADGATNTIRYQLKPGITSGNTAITVTIQDDGGTDNGGKNTYSQTFYLAVNSLPTVTISSDKGTTVSKGDIVTLTAAGAIAYSWEPASGVSGDLQQPTLTVRPDADANYKVTGTNAAGCSAVATITIHVADDYKLDAANLLTPNGDGKNDRWVIRNLDSYPDNEVKIFDRTGRLIYQRRNYSNDWDGTLNGHPLAEGTYYYVLTVNGTTRVWKGFITILRNDQ